MGRDRVPGRVVIPDRGFFVVELRPEQHDPGSENVSVQLNSFPCTRIRSSTALACAAVTGLSSPRVIIGLSGVGPVATEAKVLSWIDTVTPIDGNRQYTSFAPFSWIKSTTKRRVKSSM